MSVEQIIEAWKNPTMRESLRREDLAAMPENPAGSVAKELDEAELALAAGGHRCGPGAIPSVTAECTCNNGVTVCNWSRCTHRTHRGCS